jgi:carbamoyl-phosphate synthase large subunit
MNKINVLVTSAGVASAINIIKSLRLQREFQVYIVAVDVDKLAAGLHLADCSYISPPVKEADKYLEFLYSICKKHNIKVLYPCYSKELLTVASVRENFSEMGVATLLSPASVIDLCDDKVRASEVVQRLEIPVPRVVVSPARSNLPLFSRFLKSSSSAGAVYVDNEHLLNYLLTSREERIFQEFIEGNEYTIDVLCDQNSNVLFCGPRKRIAVKSGQSVKGITINNDILQDYVKQICKAVGIVGVCNIQFIEKENQFYFIEINPRYAAGGLMLTVHAGANLPLVALKLMLGYPISKAELRHRSNVFMTRYWDELVFSAEDLHEN